MIKKRFEMVIEHDDNGLTITGENNGFNVLELIALFDIKKSDLVEQFTKCENFTHHRICNDDGEWKEIKKKGGE